MVALIAGIVGCSGGVEHNITIVSTTDDSVTAPGEMAFAMIPGRSI
jgi:hypothetical protein